MGWMTTPDEREGWSDFFLRKGHSVFLIDQPRRDEAGQTSHPGKISNETSVQTWFTQFKIGKILITNLLLMRIQNFLEEKKLLINFSVK